MTRTDLAWLLWCYQQGYTNPDDRAVLTNWMDEGPATLHPEDVEEQRACLSMADEILEMVRNERSGT